MTGETGLGHPFLMNVICIFTWTHGDYHPILIGDLISQQPSSSPSSVLFWLLCGNTTP
jgi:hypothetical protein